MSEQEAMSREEKVEKAKEILKARQAKEKSAPAAKSVPAAETFLAEHKVESGETLSGIALKYYQSAVKEKWMAIYEANKETIGDNPGMIKVGQVLKIPKLGE